MVTIQIYGTNDYLESQDEKITYIKTSGDLSDLSKVNSSYSWSLKFPKTPNNTQVLRGLGLIGSTSSIPYNKVYCNLLDNGLPIVTKGLLNIKDTSSDYYGIFIQEGFVDFLRDLKNDSLSDLDLSQLDHQRDYTTIVNSLDLSLPYSYLIADVNGAFNPDENNTTNLRSAFMSPFANVGYIWDLIFDTYGWTYQINANTLQSINDTWMSYPSEVVLDNQLNQNVINAYTNNFIIFPDGDGVIRDNTHDNNQIFHNVRLFNVFEYLDFITPLNDYEFKVNATGNYEFTMLLNAYVIADPVFFNPLEIGFECGVVVNNQIIYSFEKNIEKTNTFYLNQNDTYKIVAYHDEVPSNLYSFNQPVFYSLNINQAYNNVRYVFDTGEVSFTKALMKFKVNTFIKEVMTREALTAFVDADNKIINFLTLTERFEQGITDWSDRYIDRKKESYTYSNYGQINTLKHKYKDELSNFNDGNILVDNANLPEDKNLYISIGFSPNNELTDFSDNGNTYKVVQIPTFEVDVKEDKNTGDLIGDYKFLKDRFFFVKAETTDKSIYIDYQIANNIPLVSTRDVLFNNIVFNKYKDFYRIGDNAKVHQIELGLSLSDILFLDLKHLYYFEQQASFYLLNKLKYETGNTTVGEFLKVDLTKKIEVQGSDVYSNSVDACASSYFQQLYIESGNQFIEINDKVFVQDITGRFVLINNNDYYIKDFDNNKVYRVINGLITTIIDC